MKRFDVNIIEVKPFSDSDIPQPQEERIMQRQIDVIEVNWVETSDQDNKNWEEAESKYKKRF